MKAIMAILAVLALAGCATTAPSSLYRSAGQVDAWQIGGEYNAPSSIIITINGEKVIDGSMGLFAGVGSREFNATYRCNSGAAQRSRWNGGLGNADR